MDAMRNPRRLDSHDVRDDLARLVGDASGREVEFRCKRFLNPLDRRSTPLLDETSDRRREFRRKSLLRAVDDRSRIVTGDQPGDVGTANLVVVARMADIVVVAGGYFARGCGDHRRLESGRWRPGHRFWRKKLLKVA